MGHKTITSPPSATGTGKANNPNNQAHVAAQHGNAGTKKAQDQAGFTPAVQKEMQRIDKARGRR